MLFRVEKQKMKIIVRISAVLVSAGILLGGMILFASVGTGCSGIISRFSKNGGNHADSEESIENLNLIRLFSSCLVDQEQIDTVYDSIPSHQTDGISLTEFDEYMRILSGLGDGQGALLSFRILKEDERQKIADALSARLPDQTDLIEDIVPVELNYALSENQTKPIIYFQEKSNGDLYLSSDWVRLCVELHRFSELYFSAIQDQNVDAVYSMLKNSYQGGMYSFSDPTVRLKAQELCHFYLLRVKAEFSEYPIQSIDISEIVFDQQGVLDEELLRYVPREVKIGRIEGGGIVISDVLKNTLKNRDLYLYSGGSRTVRIGDYSNSATFEALFGNPDLTTISRIERSEKTGNLSEPEYRLIVDYPSARICLIGSIDSDGAWEGVVTRICIRSADQDFSIGRSLIVGMTLDDYMRNYPFADETNFILETESDDLTYRMKIELSQGKGDFIAEIILETEDAKLYF